MTTKAFILSTGDELTTGKTVDTNANFIADKLGAIGVDVVGVLVVGDYPERLAWAWRTALDQADVVISTGGIGPTADDLTTETVAQVAGRDLILDQDSADRIRQLFAAMGRVMPENNLKQAKFPRGATIIPNALGTAPGFRLPVATGNGERHCVVMPGVPREMKPMMEEQVMPWLRSLSGTDVTYLSHTFQTFGISESALDELVAGVIEPSAGRIAFRAAFPQISVRVSVHGNPAEAETRLTSAAARLRERIGGYCYGEGDVTMEAVVGDLLTQRKETLAVAESCSGGLIGHRLTNIPGSSAYVIGDIVAYNNRVKMSVLGVKKETLKEHGAVSTEVASEMAAGVRQLANASYGIGTTGVAGPDGGTPDKPVGTVCIALATPEKTYAYQYKFWGTREWVKILTSQVALDWVRRATLGIDPMTSGWRK